MVQVAKQVNRKIAKKVSEQVTKQVKRNPPVMKRLYDSAIMDEGQREQMNDGCEQGGGSAYFECEHRTSGELNAVDFRQVGVQHEADGDQETGQRVGGGQVQAEQKHGRLVVNFEVTDGEQRGVQEHAD